MAEPEENSYVITVVLRDVKKAQAVEVARIIRERIPFIVDGLPFPAQVLTAHLKDEM